MKSKILVRETFDEYKKTIESNLINFTYLYDGDVKSSINYSYSEIISNTTTSPKVIINCIKKIYDDSILEMIDKSIPITIENPMCKVNIFYYIDKLHKGGFNPNYVFCSNNGRSLFGVLNLTSDRAFPSYFYHIEKYHSKGYDLYLSPLIDDEEDEVCLYVTNKSIQSLVYSIQNMKYLMCVDDFGTKHTIDYDFYDCDYTCYRLVIKNIRKIRDEKIENILNGD